VSGKSSRDRLRVTAMIDAAEEAKRDSAMGKERFMEPGQVQKSVLLDLIRLTESADKTSASLKKKNPLIPWGKLITLRNHGLVHDYAGVDLRDVWIFVREELPKIRRQLDRVRYLDNKGD
jgi:uncharacterized protein with HEPN domain